MHVPLSNVVRVRVTGEDGHVHEVPIGDLWKTIPAAGGEAEADWQRDLRAFDVVFTKLAGRGVEIVVADPSSVDTVIAPIPNLDAPTEQL